MESSSSFYFNYSNAMKKAKCGGINFLAEKYDFYWLTILLAHKMGNLIYAHRVLILTIIELISLQTLCYIHYM